MNVPTVATADPSVSSITVKSMSASKASLFGETADPKARRRYAAALRGLDHRMAVHLPADEPAGPRDRPVQDVLLGGPGRRVGLPVLDFHHHQEEVRGVEKVDEILEAQVVERRRSEERGEGKEGGRTCRSGWW